MEEGEEKELVEILTSKILDIRDDLKTVTYKVAQLEVVVEDYIDKQEGTTRVE